MSDAAVMPSWRVRPKERSRGVPGSARLWAVLGGGLLALTLAGAGAWWWLGGGAGGGVPLIRAEPTPFRVRPDDRGGMVVANQGSEVFERSAPAARPGEARLGAGPEAPRLDALRPPPQPAAAPAPSAAVAPQTQQAAQAAVAPRAGAPAAPATAPGSVLAAPAIAPPVAAGRVQIQLAAARSEEGARQEWQRLSARLPELQGRQPVIARLDRGEGQSPLFRLRTGGFADAAAARAFCDQLRAREQNQGCMVVGS